jgi:hypothetical protein
MSKLLKISFVFGPLKSIHVALEGLNPVVSGGFADMQRGMLRSNAESVKARTVVWSRTKHPVSCYQNPQNRSLWRTWRLYQETKVIHSSFLNAPAISLAMVG